MFAASSSDQAASGRPRLVRSAAIAALGLAVAALGAWVLTRPKTVEGIVVPASYQENRAAMFTMKVREIASMPLHKGGVALYGDSLTEWGSWDELLPDRRTMNFGIRGDGTEGALNRVSQIVEAEPSVVALMIGTNDLSMGQTPEEIAARCERLVARLRARLPEAEILLYTLLPREAALAADIAELNGLYADIAQQHAIKLVDFTSEFSDGAGALRREYTIDGLHLNEAGYALWASQLNPVLDAIAPQTMPETTIVESN